MIAQRPKKRKDKWNLLCDCSVASVPDRSGCDKPSKRLRTATAQTSAHQQSAIRLTECFQSESIMLLCNHSHLLASCTHWWLLNRPESLASAHTHTCPVCACGDVMVAERICILIAEQWFLLLAAPLCVVVMCVFNSGLHQSSVICCCKTRWRPNRFIETY